MAAWFPNGVKTGDVIHKIVPGGYAVVGMYRVDFDTAWENQQCGFGTGPTQTKLYKHCR